MATQAWDQHLLRKFNLCLAKIPRCADDFLRTELGTEAVTQVAQLLWLDHEGFTVERGPTLICMCGVPYEFCPIESKAVASDALGR